MAATGNDTLNETLRKIREEGLKSTEMQRIPVDLPPEYKKKLRLMAVEHDCTMKDLITEALHDLFDKYDNE